MKVYVDASPIDIATESLAGVGIIDHVGNYRYFVQKLFTEPPCQSHQAEFAAVLKVIETIDPPDHSLNIISDFVTIRDLVRAALNIRGIINGGNLKLGASLQGKFLAKGSCHRSAWAISKEIIKAKKDGIKIRIHWKPRMCNEYARSADMLSKIARWSVECDYREFLNRREDCLGKMKHVALRDVDEYYLGFYSELGMAS